MTDWRKRIGRFGVWESSRTLDVALAPHLEELGFGALWVGGTAPDLELIERLLGATDRLVLATGIVSIFTTTPQELAAAFHRVNEQYPERLLLGLGTSHPERVPDASKPYATMSRFLDGLDAAGVEVGDRVIAALGPRMLRLSAERAAGSHPYLVTPVHSRAAREALGPDALLAPEQRIVLRADVDEARAIGRPTVQTPYLGYVNYLGNLRRLGYSDEDLAGAGSDRLIDDLVVSGNSDGIAAGLRAHLDAGADHVAAHLLPGPGDDVAEGYTTIARALGLSGG